MEYIFIVNPISGKKKGLYAGRIIDEYCKSKGVNYKIIYTNKKEDAKKIAEIYSEHDNIIYSVGGDGTLNEVINGMVYSDSKLVVVPIGSGNDFYKTLKDCDNIQIDLGKVNDKYFINVASIGLDAEIAKEANELKKYNVPSKLIYVTSLFKNFFTFDSIDVNVDEDDKLLTILAICNGRYYGGGFQIAPKAELYDGLFDVISVDKLSKIKTLKLLSKLITANHLYEKNVFYTKTNAIEVSSQFNLYCNVDGEIIKGKDFLFEIENDALNVELNDKLMINELLKSKKLIK